SICVPARIGKSGVEEIVERPLDEWESERFAGAVKHLKELCGKAQ
ncbi:MAG: lactate dehydrogenase, partial [Methanomicrobium sp.]|nr:lactate dehydrogenase [Methanomicrobium sp.]